MTLNQIAEDGAYKLGDQFNYTLRESIKQTLIYYRAKYLRDDMHRNNYSAPDLFQPLVLEMKEVNQLEDIGANIPCITENNSCYAVINDEKYKILKSEFQIPRPIRLKGFGKVPYRFIGSVDRSKRFIYSDPADMEFKIMLPYQNSNTIYFFISDNYLYLLNSLNICNVLIDGIFEDPRQVFELCDKDGFTDDKEFPIPADMLMSIMDNIVSKTYPLRGQDGQRINIQRDDKDKDNV